MLRTTVGAGLVLVLWACGPMPETQEAAEPDAGVPFAVDVVAVTYGEGAGFGQDGMPGVVLGAPHGARRGQGSLDVVSLGKGGSITLRMGMDLVDGPGPDFLVFENAFSIAGTANTFSEPAEVAVSLDGVTFHTFPCMGDALPYTGCAGLRATLTPGPDGGVDPTDPELAGGDAFDLADVGLARALFVRITDRSTRVPDAPQGGFDLDAVSITTHRVAPDGGRP